MASFPAGGGSQTWLNDVVQYVSPTGNDNNNGTSWPTAKRTTDGPNGALAYLLDKGGGELNFATGAQGNIWLRGDGLDVPGFFPFMPIRVIGHGKTYSQFGDPTAGLYGGAWTGGGRFNPLVWLVKTSGIPTVLENLSAPGGYANQTVRVWDYRRYSDGSIAMANITSWDRTAGGDNGSATLTVALPTAIAATSVVRTGGTTVRVTFPDQYPLPAPVSENVLRPQYVQINSTDPNFASGSYAVTAISPTAHTVWFEYSDTGSNVTASNPITFQSHGVCAGDRIEVVSVSSEIPSTAYKVSFVADATHIVVNDYYGQSPRSPIVTVSNPGQYVLQDRSRWYGSGLLTFRNVQGACSTSQPDRFENGPSVDIGSINDGRVYFEKTAFTGMVSNIIDCKDPDRSCWMLIDCGANGEAGVTLRGDRPNGGGIRVYGGVNTWGIDAKDVIGDIEIGITCPAVKILNGNAAGVVHLDTVYTADAPNDEPNIVCDDIAIISADVNIVNCGLVQVPGFVQGGTALTGYTTRTEVPQLNNQWGFWLYNRLSGKKESDYRGLGAIATPRYSNKCVAPGSWTLNGMTATGGQADPFGGTGAYKVETGNNHFLVYDNTETVNAGDRWLFCSWVRRAGGLLGANNVGIMSISLNPGQSGFLAIANPLFKGDGEWQFVWTYDTVPNTVAATNVQAAIGVNSTLYVYEPTLIRVPAADMTNNEYALIAECLRTAPRYLPGGSAGTGEGKPFYADGGLVVGASGYASGSVAMFDGASAAVSASGTGAFRYNAGTNKIQYSKNGGAWTDLV